MRAEVLDEFEGRMVILNRIEHGLEVRSNLRHEVDFNFEQLRLSLTSQSVLVTISLHAPCISLSLRVAEFQARRLGRFRTDRGWTNRNRPSQFDALFES